jgi:cell division septum initiation protein DivIVA
MPGDPVPSSTDTGFEVVRRGYDQGQVDTHLRTLDAHISILVTDRNAALEQAGQLARELDEARVRAEKLRAQVRTLVSPGHNVQGMSERMRTMLRLAQDEVAEMLSRAETEVSRRITEAEAQKTQIIAAAQAEAETIEAQRAEALAEARAAAEATTAQRTEILAAAQAEAEAIRAQKAQIIADARAEAETIVAAAKANADELTRDLERARAELDLERRITHDQLAAEQREAQQRLADELARAEQDRARAWAESEARRATAEEDFVIALDQRRSEALAAIAAERQEAHRQAEELRTAAAARYREEEEKAKAIGRAVVGDAENRLGELIELRKRISEQLGDARVILDRALVTLTAPREQPAVDPGRSENGVVPAPRDPAAPATATAENGSDPGAGGDDSSDATSSRETTGIDANGARRRPRPRAAAGRR